MGRSNCAADFVARTCSRARVLYRSRDPRPRPRRAGCRAGAPRRNLSTMISTAPLPPRDSVTSLECLLLHRTTNSCLISSVLPRRLYCRIILQYSRSVFARTSVHVYKSPAAAARPLSGSRGHRCCNPNCGRYCTMLGGSAGGDEQSSTNTDRGPDDRQRRCGYCSRRSAAGDPPAAAHLSVTESLAARRRAGGPAA